jgi:Leucine-rich repeat (LRR) protein
MQGEPRSISSPARKQRWLAFSLRSLFVITLVVACLLGWKLHKVNQQKRAVSKIKELGGTVYYNVDTGAKDELFFEPPDWLRRLTGDDFFDYVVAVRLGGTNVEDVSFLADLPTIDNLNLSGTSVTDLAPLAKLTKLKKLDLLGVPVRDISPLSNLTNLETLSLENTNVADVAALARLVNLSALSLAGTPVADLSPLAGLVQLKELKLFFCPNVTHVDALAGLTLLEYLDLSDTKVADIEPFTGLKALGFLSLSRTEVDPADTARLRTLLPKCRITHNR